MIKKDFKLINTHKVFDVQENESDYKFSGFSELFSNEEKYFWFIIRKELIKKYMDKHIKKDSKIIEVGAGTGNVTQYLMKNGWSNISVGEMHLNALDYAKSYGIENRYCFNLLDSPFENEFDCVCAFDVIEHIENDKLALENIYKSLNGGGDLVISVPSFSFLWNAHDVDVGHKRRYTKKSMEKLLKETGFSIVTMKYFFISVVPLLFIRKLLHPAKIGQIPKGDIIPTINPAINKILISLLRVENKLIDFLPNIVGGSLFVIAKKSE